MYRLIRHINFTNQTVRQAEEKTTTDKTFPTGKKTKDITDMLRIFGHAIYLSDIQLVWLTKLRGRKLT